MLILCVHVKLGQWGEHFTMIIQLLIHITNYLFQVFQYESTFKCKSNLTLSFDLIGIVRPPMMVGNMIRPVAPPASFPNLPNPIQRPGLQQPRQQQQQRPPRPPTASSAPVPSISTGASVSMKDLQVPTVL